MQISLRIHQQKAVVRGIFISPATGRPDLQPDILGFSEFVLWCCVPIVGNAFDKVLLKKINDALLGFGNMFSHKKAGLQRISFRGGMQNISMGLQVEIDI